MPQKDECYLEKSFPPSGNKEVLHYIIIIIINKQQLLVALLNIIGLVHVAVHEVSNKVVTI